MVDASAKHPNPWRRTDVTTDLVTVIPELLHHVGAAEVELIWLRRPSSLHTGDINSTADGLIRAARNEYRARGYGFWDSLLSAAVLSDDVTRRAILSRAIQHYAAPPTPISMDEFVAELRRGAYAGLPSREMVSLSSRVTTAAGVGHLPMLDFSLPHSASADDTAVEVASVLGIDGGYLLRSGTSYHLLGDHLTSWQESTELLARAQLLSPLIDHRWAAHQLIDQFCSLRVSTDDSRHPISHTLIATTHAPAP